MEPTNTHTFDWCIEQIMCWQYESVWSTEHNITISTQNIEWVTRETLGYLEWVSIPCTTLTNVLSRAQKGKTPLLPHVTHDKLRANDDKNDKYYVIKLKIMYAKLPN